MAIYNIAASDRGFVNTAKSSNSQPHKAASSSVSKTESDGKKKSKNTSEKNSKKAAESRWPGDKIKAKENPTNPTMKGKKNYLN